MLTKPIRTPITAAGYTAIKIPDPPDRFIPVTFYAEDNSDFYIDTTSDAGTDVTLVSADAPKVAIMARAEADGTIFYAKGTTSTNLIVWRGRP